MIAPSSRDLGSGPDFRGRRRAGNRAPARVPLIGSPSRPGIALAITLVALIVVAALVAGAHALAIQSHRDGRDALLEVRALGAAELGIASIFAPGGWDAAWNGAADPGRLALRTSEPAPGTTDSVSVVALAPASALVISTGRAGPPELGARRRIALLVALVAPRLAPLAALAAGGAVRLAGGSRVSGDDAPPDRPDCPPPNVSIPGIAMAYPSLLTTADCPAEGCIAGSIPVLTADPAALADALDRFGAVDRATLVPLAGRTIAGGTTMTTAPALSSGGRCDTASPANWGDPVAGSPCAGWLPVIHAVGDLHLAGGVGQGVLLVDGDLTMDGGALFAGLVVVRGELRVAGASIVGAAVADRATLGAGADVRLSRCALGRAAMAAAAPRPAPRGWFELE